MTVTLGQQEIGDAVIEYLGRRGVAVNRSQLMITYKREEEKFYVIIMDAELPPKEGPYR